MMSGDSEVKRSMSDLVGLLSPRYTDEELVHAKQMQRGYTALRDQMRAHGRVVLAVHGHPEAVMLSYQDVKTLWNLFNDLVEKAENNSLLALAAERLTNQTNDRVPLEQGLAEMREALLGSSSE